MLDLRRRHQTLPAYHSLPFFRRNGTHDGDLVSYSVLLNPNPVLPTKDTPDGCEPNHHHYAYHVLCPQSEQTVGPQVPEAVGPLRPVQPQPALHQAVHRVRADGHGGRVLPLLEEGDTGAALQHHEGDQPPPWKPSTDALRTYTSGRD